MIVGTNIEDREVGSIQKGNVSYVLTVVERGWWMKMIYAEGR